MSDESAIDEKKNNTDSTNDFKPKNIWNFILSLLVITIIVLSYFGMSGCILYMCKVAQSNILPNKGNCMPYKSGEPKITPIKTNIFVTYTSPPLSEKISFPYLKNKQNTILDMLREYKENPETNFLLNYFISIMENMMLFNYSSINVFFNFLNQIPELFIILLGPIITFFYMLCVLGMSYLVLFGSWFYEMTWFMKKNMSETGKAKWENRITLVNLFIAWCLLWIFVVFLIIGMLFGIIPLLPVIIMWCCLFTALMCKSEMNGSETSVFVVMKELFKHYKITIMTTLTALIILMSFMSLGNLTGLISIITIVLIYFGKISVDIYHPVKEAVKLSELVSYAKADKTCDADKKSVGTKIMNTILQRGGNNLTSEIKKLQKMMN